MSSHLPFFRRPDGRSAPLAFAHRGFSLDGLENSAAAFRAALELGYTHLETDARTSADGVVLLFHDDTLDRVTDAHGPVSKVGAAEIAKARIGGREAIPHLADLLTEFPGARLNIDVKDWHTVKALAAVIDQLDAHDRVLIASFSDRRRRAVLRLLGRRTASSAGIACIAAFTLLGPLLPDGWLRRIVHDVDALQVPARYGPLRVVTPGFLRRAHRLGLQVHVWTVNDSAEMAMLLDMGVDGLVTDRADRLKSVLQARGQWW
ncbi:glycerophosphodiester phosphodiesterase family protein [Arthrobacter bambusae]|uniref:glycerophosphodiester phosphodiesterase family protein n=1 Tax=Arthrobacter bambusae TaxID=1338426 RepID=UPI00277F9829|nr:glycerophosphodiester phosphodiesterase family protein [Arthrobacter bambusae]MDQ0029755.1 glycerophosphoryl diester phosphodiesterase [Arthrobacter bambusae]MDQ0097727.1 glycerophosphoryl diester phosphodiesterase [Arthrobacter bambusae]